MDDELVEENLDELNIKSGTSASIGKQDNFFTNNLADVQAHASYAKRGSEATLMNDKTKSSVLVRENGQINLASSKYSQIKLNPEGKIMLRSFEHDIMSNRVRILSDEIIINEHKLNPYLYELTDMKHIELPTNDDVIVGNFCVLGTVLTKSWDINLKRYVMIRRLARIPMFSPKINVPAINTGLGIVDPLAVTENILVKTDKGYQVNAVVKDADSLIGKEGVNREGIISDPVREVSDYDTTIDGKNMDGTSAINTTDNVNVLNNQYAQGGTLVEKGEVPNSLKKAAVANTIAKNIGVNAKLLWAQMAHETGNFTSELSVNYHNYGGFKDASSKYAYGQDSRGHSYFHSDEAYVQYVSWYFDKAQWNDVGKYIQDAKTVNEYANILKLGGYYTDAIDNYIEGMTYYMGVVEKTLQNSKGVSV